MAKKTDTPQAIQNQVRKLREHGASYEEIKTITGLSIPLIWYYTKHVDPMRRDGHRKQYREFSDLKTLLKPGPLLKGLPLPTWLLCLLEEQAHQPDTTQADEIPGELKIRQLPHGKIQ